MKTISRETLELVLQSFESSSKDETRLFLTGVKLGRDHKNRSIVESCDGHILSRHFVDSVAFLGDTNEVIIAPEGKKAIKNLLTNNKYAQEFLVALDTNNQTISFSNNDQREGITIPLIAREYPKTDALIPSEKVVENYLEIAINPELLARLFKSLNKEKSSRNKSVKLRIDKNNNLAPIVVQTQNDTIGLLMPRKV